MSASKSEFLSYKKQELFISDDSGNFTATDGDGSHITPSHRVDPTASVMSTGLSLTEDGCYTSGMSMSEYLTSPSTPRNSCKDSYLKAIFDNFNELYQDKMTWIDENISGGDNHQAKKNVLEHWVKDVIEQNNILVQTVEELEVEAEKKVQNLQKKVSEAAEVTKEHMAAIKEYEDQIKQLVKEKHIVDKQEEFFRKETMYLEKEKRRALDRLHTLENDNSNLVTLINRIRDMGVWDINGLNFSARTFDAIFGLYPSLAGSEVQTVFTREKARSLEKAETNIAQLVAQVDELHNRKNEAEKLLTEKTKVTEELQHDIKDLNSKIKQYQEEHQEIKRSLKETQDQLKTATLKNQVSRPSTADTKRGSEMKEMLTELRDLRNQLNIACTERQQAMKESNSLKTELRGRIAQMEDMKCLLDQIQSEAASTRTAVQDVQDKQDQMTSLKEKITFYQESYENSNLLLEAKSEIIVKLQDQMEQLHDKVTKLEKSRSSKPSNPPGTTVSPSGTPSRHYSRPSSQNIQPTSQSKTGSMIRCLKKQQIKDAIRKPAVKVKKSTLVTPRSSKGEQKHHDSKRHHSSSHHKTPWNDNFVRSRLKPSSPRTSTSENRLKTQSSSKYGTELKVIHKGMVHPVKSESSAPTRNEKVDEKRIENLKLGAGTGGPAANPEGHSPVNRIIADYLGQSDTSGKLSSLNERRKTLKQRIVERVKFPPISSKFDSATTSMSQATAKAYKKALEDHLPQVIVKEKKMHTASGIQTLENLMEVCVKASRELNRQADLEGKGAPKYRVVTGHSHRRHSHRSRENTYTVEAVPKNGPSKQDQNGPNKPTGAISRPSDVGKSGAGKKEESSESESSTLSDISQFRRVALHPPPIFSPPHFLDDRSPERILADLPKESHDYLVKKWIISSPSPSCKKGRKERGESEGKSHSQNITDPSLSRPDSRGKFKSATRRPLNLKLGH